MSDAATLRRDDVTRSYGAIVVVLAALVVYAGALQNGFALDDAVLIPSDARVLGAQIGKLLTTTYWNDPRLGLYRPLTSVTFGLDWYVSHGSAAWFHLVNVGWHALASLLAYLLLTRFFRPAAALVGGLAFALHPVHVEAVANVVGRSELIAATFFFAACLIWTSRNLSLWPRALLTGLCYLCALFAKESAVVLPAVLLLLDGAQGELKADYARARWRAYVPVLAALLLFVLARLAVVGGFAPQRLDPALEMTRGIGQRWMTALQVWPVAARLLFFPLKLLADYDPRTLMPLTEWTPQAVLGLTLLFATVVGGVAALLRRNYYWALALLWFPITIFTVSNLVVPIGVLLAERTLYLPSFVVAFALAAAYAALPVASTRAAALRAAVAALMLALAVRVVTRVPVWASTDSVMLSVARQAPGSFRAQAHLARMARAHNDVARALQLYDRTLTLWPYRESLVQEAAAYGTSTGQAAWARNVALFGARRWPRNVNFYHMIAGNAVDLGDTTLARRAVREGLRLHPRDSVLTQMWHAFGRPDSIQ